MIPHAMHMADEPLLALYVWREQLTIALHFL